MMRNPFVKIVAWAICSSALATLYADEFALPKQVPVREGVAELTTGAKLWYWDTGGSGDAVVLMHPYTMHGAAWPFQQPALAKAGFRVIGYSRRGHYRSPATDDSGAASDDLLALLDHLKLNKVHLVAAAQGGSFAVDFAISHQQRVLSMTLMSSLLGIDEPEYEAMLRRLLPPFFQSLPPDFKELGPSYRASNPEGVAHWKRLVALGNSHGQRASRKNRVNWASLRSLKIPILVVGGKADLYAPPPLLKLQAKHLDDATLVLFPEVGHSAYWETPQAFNRTVIDFMKRHRRK